MQRWTQTPDHNCVNHKKRICGWRRAWSPSWSVCGFPEGIQMGVVENRCIQKMKLWPEPAQLSYRAWGSAKCSLLYNVRIFWNFLFGSNISLLKLWNTHKSPAMSIRRQVERQWWTATYNCLSITKNLLEDSESQSSPEPCFSPWPWP